MESSREKLEPTNSSLQLLQAYDSSDSCEEMDDSNHNSVLQEIRDFTLNNTQSDLFKEVYANVNLESRDINEVREASEGCTDDADDVTKNNVIDYSEHGPVDEDISEPHQAAESLASPVAESKIPVIDCEMLVPRDANRWSDEESSSDDSSQESESDSSSEWESLKGAGVTSDSDEANSNNKPAVVTKKIAPKVKGEMGLEDLPPIEDLTISVPNKECILMGTIYDIVDRLVIVEAFPNKPTLDLDTVLFLDEGARTLGHIYDVFGQVFQPFYCVRFNSKDHINDKGIICGMCVYCAPKTEHTNLVFVSDLMRMKGSDASWKDDVEPPAQFLEFSDDEEERKAKHTLKEKKKKANASATEVGESSDSSTNKRYKPTPYEERMNKRNLEKSAEIHKINQQPSQPQQGIGIGYGRGMVPGGGQANFYNPFGPRYDTVPGQSGGPPDIQWSPNNSFYVGQNPFDFTQQRFRMAGQFELPRVPQRVPRSPFAAVGRGRFTSFPPPGLWFVNRPPGSPWPPPPPPGFPPAPI